MKICYNGFWPTFYEKNNWFNYMFQGYFTGERIEFSKDPNGADIIINSVFGPAIKEGKARNIFFTGEPFKTGYTPDQVLLGFDKTNISKQKYRLPLWMVYVNWWPGSYNANPTDLAYNVNFNNLVKSRTEKEVNDILDKEFFCCVVASNPVENRIIAYNELSNIEQVDGYGNIFNNYIPNKKLDVLKHYKFNICFENTIQEGYVTEKIYEALIGGTIPIYYGDSMSKEDFNPKAFIDYTTMGSMEELVNEVKKVYSSRDLMVEYLSQPITNTLHSLDDLYEFFDNVKLV